MSLQSLSLLDKNVCTAEEYQRFLRDDGTITCLTKGDTLGLQVIVEAGLVSLAAILFLFIIITRNSLHIREARKRLFHRPIDLLMFSLLLADTIQATGMVLNIRWIMLGKVELGRYCTTQGIIKAVGAIAVTFFTLMIAIYTFLGVWIGRSVASMRTTLFVVGIIWFADALIAMLGSVVNTGEGKPSYMSIAPYWCSTNKHYVVWKTASDYVWRWITLFFSILIYIPLFLWLRGNIDFDEHKWWKLYFRRAPQGLHVTRGRSLIMLAYPFVYCVLILPLTLVRWISHWGSHEVEVPSAATFAVDAVFGLSGFFNVILLVTTRPEAGLFGQLIFAPSRPPSTIELDERDADREMEDDDRVRLPG